VLNEELFVVRLVWQRPLKSPGPKMADKMADKDHVPAFVRTSEPVINYNKSKPRKGWQMSLKKTTRGKGDKPKQVFSQYYATEQEATRHMLDFRMLHEGLCPLEDGGQSKLKRKSNPQMESSGDEALDDLADDTTHRESSAAATGRADGTVRAHCHGFRR
jgi:hypothetical protein